MHDIILMVIDYTEKTIEQRCKWKELFEFDKEIHKKFETCLKRNYPYELDFTKEKEIIMKSYLDYQLPERSSFIYQKGCKFNYSLYVYCWSSKILNSYPESLSCFIPDKYMGIFSHPFVSNGIFKELNQYFKNKNIDNYISYIDEFYWWVAYDNIDAI